MHKLLIMELGKPAPGQSKHQVSANIKMDQDAISDFPIHMEASTKYGIVFVFTKYGYLFLFEVSTGLSLCRYRITENLPI